MKYSDISCPFSQIVLEKKLIFTLKANIRSEEALRFDVHDKWQVLVHDKVLPTSSLADAKHSFLPVSPV